MHKLWGYLKRDDSDTKLDVTEITPQLFGELDLFPVVCVRRRRFGRMNVSGFHRL
jgi:hypothetical protein